MLKDFFLEGGWGMYPTVIFGFALLAVAMILALRPERRFLAAAACLMTVTMASGALGCTMGVIRTFAYLHQVPAASQLSILGAGCAESLNNLVLALIIVIIASLVSLVGAIRSALVSVAPLAAAT